MSSRPERVRRVGEGPGEGCFGRKSEVRNLRKSPSRVNCITIVKLRQPHDAIKQEDGALEAGSGCVGSAVWLTYVLLSVRLSNHRRDNLSLVQISVMDAVFVGLLGLGNVGSAVARLLDVESARLTRRAGRPIEIASALVRDLNQDRKVPLGRDRIVTDWRQVVQDPKVSVVIELMGGTTETLPVVLAHSRPASTS